MDAITLHPEWKQAIADFMGNDPKPGDIVRHEWLMAAFGIKEPQTAKEKTLADLAFLRQFTRFRNTLLEDYCIDLKSVIGVGYEVVPPGDQTRLAVETRMKNVHREMASMVKQISFVRLNQLTDAQRRENADALAKAAQLNAMLVHARIAPPPPFAIEDATS